jgi:prophage tail gpP-like protein
VSFQALDWDTELVKGYRIRSAFTRSTDDFEIVLYDTDRKKLRNLEMQPVELFINGCSQMLGRIDMSEIGGDGSAVTFRGRDYIADLVENNVDPTLKLAEGTTLDQAFLDAMSPCGITIILGDDDVLLRNVRTGKSLRSKSNSKGRLKELTVQDLKPRGGEGTYEFCNRIAARYGVMIQPGPDRSTVVVQGPQYEQDPIGKIVRTDDARQGVGNNIISATATRDYSTFPTYTLFTGRSSQAGEDTKPLQFEIDIIDVVQGAGELEQVLVLNDATIGGRRKPAEVKGTRLGLGQLYRLLYFRDDDSRTSEQLERAALRAFSERLRDTLVYTVTLQGHSDPMTGAVYAIDTIIDVRDEICGINEKLWVESREFAFDPQAGAVTRLTCWRPRSFTI